MSTLLRNPASVPALFSRSVDEDITAPIPAKGWRGALRALATQNVSAALAAAGSGFLAALVDVPLVQVASHVATSPPAG